MIKKLGRVMMVALAFLYAGAVACAEETQDPIVDAVNVVTEPILNVTENSKPIFDPDAFDLLHPKPEQVDKFTAKLQKKRSEFEKKQLKRQRDFLDGLSSGNWTEDEKSQETRDFFNDQKKRERDFFRKQQKKIDRQAAKMEKQRTKKFPQLKNKTLYDKMSEAKQSFLSQQMRDGEDFLSDLQSKRGDISDEKYEQSLREFNQKQREDRQDFFKKQRAEVQSKQSSNDE